MSGRLSKQGQQFVVSKLRVMYGEGPPADALGEVLVKLSMARLKELAVAREQPPEARCA